MKITLAQIEGFLADRGLAYELVGEAGGSFTIASLFAPIDNGFYFANAGAAVPPSAGSLFLTDGELVVTDSAVVRIDADPQRAFYDLLATLFGEQSNGSIATTAVVHPDAQLGRNVQIEDFVVLDRCVIGDDCIIGSHTRIYEGTTLGHNVVIGAQSVIGTRGMAWVWSEDGARRIIQPQLGGVTIEDNCILGAGAIIVRGSLNEDTRIGHDTIIAPGVRLGHGTVIEPFVHFANNVITGGNARIGSHSFVGSAAVFRPKAKVHPTTVVGAGAVVVKDTSGPGLTLAGVPAKERETKAAPAGMPKPVNSKNGGSKT